MVNQKKHTIALLMFGLFAVTSLFGMPLQLASDFSPSAEENTFDGRLHSLWERYRTARVAGDEETCKSVHRELLVWKAQGGAQIFELAGYLFLEQGLDGLAHGNLDAARQEFKYALDMNPCLWPAYDGLAKIKKEEGRYQQYFDLTQKGIYNALSMENSYLFVDALIWFLFNLAWVVVLGFSIIAIILSLKYLRPMYRTTMGYFEYHQVSPLYGTLLSLVLLLSPLFLGVNLTLIGAAVVVLFYPFYNASERKVTLAVFAIAMSLPILNLAMTRLSDIRSDPLLRTQMAQYFTGVDQRLANLQDRPGQGPISDHSLLVIGNLRAVQGDDLKALESFEGIQKSSPLWALAQVNIGNIRFKKQKEYQMAITSYEDALKANPELGEALYNLHVVYSAMDKVEEANRYRTRAFESSKANKERAQLAAPGEVLYCAPDYSRYFASAIIDVSRFPGSFSISSFELWSPLVGLILLFVCAGIHSRLRNASLMGKTCVKCGRIYFQSDSVSQEWCGQCMSLYVKKEDLPIEAKNLKYEQVRKFSRRKRITAIVSQILLPGSLKLLQGKAAGGAFAIFFWLFLVVFSLFPLTGIAHPMMNYLDGVGLVSWLWYSVTLVFWFIFGLRPLWQEE